MTVDLISVHKQAQYYPLAGGVDCTHGRPVLYNLEINYLIHVDDRTDCDGNLVIDGETGWRY